MGTTDRAGARDARWHLAANRWGEGGDIGVIARLSSASLPAIHGWKLALATIGPEALERSASVRTRMASIRVGGREPIEGFVYRPPAPGHETSERV